MTRNSARLSLLVAAILFFSSALPIPAPAQTVSFIARSDFAAGTNPHFVAVGDFNGDGKLDLAGANADLGARRSLTENTTVSVRPGNGVGTFQSPRNFGGGSSPRSVAVGDFNGDRKQDLAVANAGSTTVSVLLGNGDGTFQPAASFVVGTNGPWSVAVGDFNGDGKQDLAAANYGSPTVSVLLGNGDGTFQRSEERRVGKECRSRWSP